MKFLFLLLDNIYMDALEQAAKKVRSEHKINIELKIYLCKQLKEGSPAWSEFERDLAASDFFFANMIVQNEQAFPLVELLKKYEPLKPERALVILNSMPMVMNQIKMGNFEWQKMLHFMKSGPVAKVTGFMGSVNKLLHKDAKAEARVEEQERLREEADEVHQKRLKTRKPVKKGVHSGMVAMMRTLPAVLKLIPGQAQDLRAYLLFMLYWLNGSPENLENLFLFAIDRYIPAGKNLKLKVKEPIIYPRLALFHPDAPGKTWESREEFDKWLAKRNSKLKGQGVRPKIGLITMRAFYLTGNYKHIDALVRELDKLGVDAVPSYAAGLDFRPTIETFFLDEVKGEKKGELKPVPTVDLIMNLSGFSMVGGGAENDAPAAIAQLERSNVPAWAVIPLFFQSEPEWRENATGLNPVQAALQVAIPELDGAGEPRVYAAGAERGQDKALYAMPEELRRLASRAARAARLRHIPVSEKKVTVILFNFPPNKGNTGTAAYLSVFESLYRLMREMKTQGYQIDLPADAEELRRMVCEGNSGQYGTAANLHTHLPTSDYMRLFPAWTDIEKMWGPPPGALLSDRDGLQIIGRQFGNLLVAVQPTFGYEDDPMRLLMAKDASPHHGFAAFYTYLDKVWKSDAVLHFGTHGAMEFMPGKQLGLSAKCWPDRLIGDLPNFYLYSVNNPSEGTIAKRRGFATLLSYLSPPMEVAGLYQNLLQLKDTISVYRKAIADGYTFKKKAVTDTEEYKINFAALGVADSGGDPFEGDQDSMTMLLESIKEQAAAIELRVKISPDEDPDGYVLSLYNALLEVEERLIPTGLHTIDEAPNLEMLADMLVSISSFARGRAGTTEEAPAIPELIATGLGWKLEDVRRRAKSENDALARWERLTNIHREAVKIFTDALSEGAKVAGSKAAKFLSHEANVPEAKSLPMWEYLAEVAEALQHNTEIKQILRALAGEYIEPSPGNDIVRNPAVLPTGRNIHAMDPGLIPTAIARRNGEKLCKAMLERARADMGLPEGQYPETIAMILWGTDNIKTDGEGVAQALALMGARATTDQLGKVSEVKLLPLKELGRARLDVVCTVSGIFRDLMPNQMELIDKAVRLAAQADEPITQNFIKKHVQEEMQKGATFDEAVARVFSNAPGNYGANVNFMVESGAWEDEGDLSEAFLSRKGFVYGAKVEGESARQLMEKALSRVQLTFQNVDSTEIGITDVDHYFEYLGGVTKTVEKLNGGARPPVLMAESLSATSGGLSQGNGIRSLEEMVRLESRSKLLNPKWYEGMLKHGYEGVREIEVRVNNTFGWSATTRAVDGWVYDGIDNTFVLNDEMRDRLTELNPYAFKGIVGRLLEANGRGYWDADAATIERLKEIYSGLEDEIEGLGEPTNPAARTAGRTL
jgi:magnesium chelatase subunit H